MSNDVDAVERIAQREREREELANDSRGASSIGTERNRAPAGTKIFLAFIVSIAIAIAATISYRAIQAQEELEEKEKEHNQVGKVVPNIDIKPIENNKSDPVNSKPFEGSSNEYDGSSQEVEPQKTPLELAIERKMRGGLNNNSTAVGTINGDSAGKPTTSPYSDDKRVTKTGLARDLAPLRLKPEVAGQIPNRDLFITQGRSVPCRLEGRIVTDVSGFITCSLVRDVYSTSGNVVLLDRQTLVTGHYKSGIAQGQARIFVTWDRAETPEGVLINLTSPGAGPLGAAGVGGYIDTHFWDRFGGALMLSIIDDFAEGVTKNNNSSNNQVNFNHTTQSAQNLATEALKNTIDIPPTLYKNHGEIISIMVARDLDFRGVYELTVQ